MLYVGHCLAAKAHIRIEVLVEHFSPILQKVFEVSIQLLALIFFIYLIPSAMKLTIAQHKIISTGVCIPYSFVYGSVVLGSVFLIFHIIENLILTFFDKEAAG
jgi:TRAP-type C4-dicarboxylate transport system permease small subunit